MTTLWASAALLDGGLDYLAANATKLVLVKRFDPGNNAAAVTAAKLAEVALVSGDYTKSNNGSNREITTAAGKSAASTASSQQYDNGTASAGAAATLTDAAKAWGANAHAGRAVVISAGTGAGQMRRIVSNTTTVATVTPNWATNPDATSVYKIVDDLAWVFCDAGGNPHYATEELTDRIITAPDPVNFPQLTYRALQPVSA